jgi:hypothetical protein
MQTRSRTALAAIAGALSLVATGALLYGLSRTGLSRPLLLLGVGSLGAPPRMWGGVLLLEKAVQAAFLLAVHLLLPRGLRAVRVGLLCGALLETPWPLLLYSGAAAWQAPLVLAPVWLLRLALSVEVMARVLGAQAAAPVRPSAGR